MFDLESALGIDIRSDRLILSVVARNLQGYSLKRHEVIENYRSLDFSELQSRVQQYLRSVKFNRENVLVGVARDRAVVRYVELPLEVEENLEQVVRFQVDKLEPTDERQSYYDYAVLGRNEKDKNILLQIVMLPRAFLDDQLTLFRELNLYPAAVRLSSIGLQQVFAAHQDGYPKDPCIVLNVDQDCMEIVVVAGPNKCFSHSARMNPEDLTLERILVELDLFVPRLHLSGQGIHKIYLCGSRGQEFLEPFQARFGESELLAAGLTLKQRAANGDSEELLHSVGLAISGIRKSSFSNFNLIPREKRLLGQRTSYIPTLALASLLVILLVALGTRSYFQQRNLEAALESQLVQLRPQVEEVNKMQTQVDVKLAEVEELKQLMTGRQKVLLAMKELTERLPDNAYLQALTVQGDKVNMTGFSDSASTLINILQASPYLKNIESRYITQDRPSGKEKFNFEATIQGTDTVEP